MTRTIRSNGLIALASALLLGVAGVGCNQGDSSEESAGDSTTSTSAAGPTSTTAPPPPAAVVVAYTVTNTLVPGSEATQVEPPAHYRVEYSLDGASYRKTSDDGSGDDAYDAASGRGYGWYRADQGIAEAATVTRGAPSGGPDHRAAGVAPNPDAAVLVRALGRAGDPKVTAITSHGRPAWHYDGPMTGDQLGSPPIDDHVVVDVDQASGAVLLEVISAKGHERRRTEATSIEDRATEDRSRYRPDPPHTAKVNSEDLGFRAVTLDELAEQAGYDVLVPATVPAGFELTEVVFDARKPLSSGAEGLNPAPAKVAALRWQGPKGASFSVTLRPENGDPKAKADGQVWSDPFGGEGVPLPSTKVSLPLEGRPALAGEMFVAAPDRPHLWGISGDLVVTVDGDLDAAGLKSVAGSLRKHPKPAGPNSAAAPTGCSQIGFTPNSDDVAADIKATGVDCTEASALVRRVRERHDPVTGPRSFDSPPWTCRAVRQDSALESTAYRCDDGAHRVTWEKT